MSLSKRKADTEIESSSKKSSLIKHEVKRTSSLEAPIMLLTGHESEVFSVKFSPSGNHLASSSFDRTIRHSGAVLEVNWSIDGSKIFSCSSDRTVCIWDAETGERVKKFKGHTNIVNSCSRSLDSSNLIISGSDDCTFKIWDLKNPKNVLSGTDSAQVTAVSFSKDSNHVFIGGVNNEIKQFDLRNLTDPVYSLTGHLDTITGLRLHPNGTKLLSNAMDNTVRVWDIKAFSSNRQLSILEGAPHGMEKHLLRPCWSSDGDFCAVGSADRTVVVWDVARRSVVYKLPGHKGCVTEVDWHPTEPIILSGSNDKTMFMGEIDPKEVRF